MAKHSQRFLRGSFLHLLLLSVTFPCSYGDVGTAALYNPPYLPTACFGSEESQFPTNDLFAAAGEGIWDNGASCGRQYLVRCISASNPKTCFPEQTIQIQIVDRAETASSRPTRAGATFVLSNAAYSAIADPSAAENLDDLAKSLKLAGLGSVLIRGG